MRWEERRTSKKETWCWSTRRRGSLTLRAGKQEETGFVRTKFARRLAKAKSSRTLLLLRLEGLINRLQSRSERYAILKYKTRRVQDRHFPYKTNVMVCVTKMWNQRECWQEKYTPYAQYASMHSILHNCAKNYLCLHFVSEKTGKWPTTSHK